MTPEERKQKIRREQIAGRLAIWQAEKEELVPIRVLELENELVTVKYKIYVERKMRKQVDKEIAQELAKRKRNFSEN